MSARATQSGTISFGLVSIPVKFYTAASSEQVRFNMLHTDCGGRIKQQLYCPVHDAVVSRNETIKGYEYSKGEYVKFEEDELRALESSRDSSINIVEFVPLERFDFIQVEKSYYLGPDKGGDKAYRLLSQSMKEAKKVAVGLWAARGKEQLIVIRPYRDGLLFHQMYYADEVRSFDDIDTGATFDFHEAEQRLAHQLIDQLSKKEFEVEKYEDSFRKRILTAVEQKVAGQKLQLAPEAPRAQIFDLVEAPKQSLEKGSTGSASSSEQPLPPKKARDGADDDDAKSTSTG
jgi:DNA end-binding protein Ku